MPPDYAYRGLVAESWDLFTGDVPRPDRDFFLEIVRRHGGPVLDAGCGTGRLLLDFIAEGHDVDGLDVSPEMLDICEEKADRLGVTIDVYLQPMEELDLAREYGTIMVPAPAFQMITDAGRARQGLARFHEHVQVGGAVAIAFAPLWDDDEPATVRPDDWTLVGQVRRDATTDVRWSTRSWIAAGSSLRSMEDRYEIVSDGVVIAAGHHVRDPGMRGYTVSDAVALFTSAGFDDVDVYENWSLEPATGADAETFVVLGTRTGSGRPRRG